jgi:hypothetical protein
VRERERIIIREGGSDQFFWPLKRGDAQNGGLAEGYGGGGIFTVLVAVLQSAKKSTHSNICSSFSGMSVYNMRLLLSPLLLCFLNQTQINPFPIEKKKKLLGAGFRSS